MKRNLLVLVFCSLLLVGCTTQKESSFNNSSTQNSGEITSDNSGGTSQGSNGSSNQSSGNNSSSGGNSSEGASSEEQSDLDKAEDLGVMTVAQAKEYILNHTSDISLNTADIGIDKTHKITIKAYALEKFDLVKTKKAFGLDVSYPAKVVMGDHTDYIACASNNGDGKTLFGKVGDYAGQSTSRYEVTGFPSIYLGQPEICVPDQSFSWNQSMDITKNIDAYYDSSITLDSLYNSAKNMHYNCAGHGYGDIVKVENLTCYDLVSGNLYLFTNGTSMIKVLKGTCTATVGSKYNVVGMLTIQNYSPAIRALKIESVSNSGDALDLSSAIVQGATALRSIPTPKEDTNTRYDNFVMSFKNIYKADVYLGIETHSSKCYVGFTDSYLGSSDFINGNELALSKGFVYINNNNFWNTTETELAKYNGYYEDYICENKAATIYYVPAQMSEYKTYSSTKYPNWKVTLIRETIPSVS